MANNYTKMSAGPCPKCYMGYLENVGERTGGFSGGKALLGAALAGPIGLDSFNFKTSIYVNAVKSKNFGI